MIAFAAALRSVMPRGEKLVIKVFACLAGAGLVVSWLLVSTLGTNNDLGLRAILLAEVVLIVMTAAGMAGLQERVSACADHGGRTRRARAQRAGFHPDRARQHCRPTTAA